MLCKTNAGGGGGVATAWAYIGVTYPEGSTCTASNGLYTLSAPDTSGLYVFGVPEPLSTPETWTVTSTNGVKTKTAEVEISDHYQNTVVVLRYSRLPEGYQEVEYLESTDGGQYIDIFKQLIYPYNYEFELTYVNLSTKTGSVCGNSNSASGAAMRIGRYSSVSSPLDYSFTGLDSGSYSTSTTLTGNAYGNETVTVVINNDENKVVENDTEIGSLSGFVGGSLRLLLFTDTSSGVQSGTTARIISFTAKNKQSEVVEKNYVPCYRISDDVAGFYDLASNSFVTNDGDGTFTVGADV